jgi:hypothetical protein
LPPDCCEAPFGRFIFLELARFDAEAARCRPTNERNGMTEEDELAV